MLSPSEKQQEIERRNKAGSGALPNPRDGEHIIQMYGIAGSLYILSQFGIYRMRTAEEIDPEVTQKNVPWSIGQYLSIGTCNPLIHSSFGVFEQCAGSGILNLKAKQKIPELLLEFAVSVAELEYAKSTYEAEFSKFQKEWIDSNKQPDVDGTTLQLPRLETFEISFGIYYSSAKRAVGKLLAILEWACDFEPKYGTRLDKLLNRIRQEDRLSDIHDLAARLDDFCPAVHLVNEIRNSYEHPSEKRNVLLKNIHLRPDMGVMMPTWTLIHDEIQLPENQDHGTHLEAVKQMICNLAEQIILLAAAALDDGRIAWEATIREPSDIRPEFPCRWRISILGFVAKE